MNYCVQITTTRGYPVSGDTKSRIYREYQHVRVSSIDEARSLAEAMQKVMKDSLIEPGVRIPQPKGWAFLTFETLEDLVIDWQDAKHKLRAV